jgi:hypothetical protein
VSRQPGVAVVATKIQILPGSRLEALSKALSRDIEFQCEMMSAEQILEQLKALSQFPGLLRLPTANDNILEKRMTFSKAKLSLYSWLELLADELNDGYGPEQSLVFLVREYGFSLSPRELGPPQAKTLAEFWKEIQANQAKPMAP